MRYNTHRITIAVIIAAIATFVVTSCNRESNPEQEPEWEPYEAVEINDIVIKSEYITDKDFRCPFNVILPSNYKSSG